MAGSDVPRRLLRAPAAVLASAAVAVAAIAVAAPAGAGLPGTAPPPPATPPTPRPVDWRLDQAGRDPRSLDLLAFGSGSCLPGTLEATARETRRRIAVTVRSTSTSEVCTRDYRAFRVTVRLAAPVRGRAVVGSRRLPDPTRAPRPAGEAARVPRLTGLAPDDAVAAARRHALRPRLERVADLRGLPRVIGQAPASGRAAARGAAVTLFVSR